MGKRGPKSTQNPGQFYTFVNKSGEKDSGILPYERGTSNEFAHWASTHWTSRKFDVACRDRRIQGLNSQGLLGRMKYLIAASRQIALKKGYKPYLIAPEEMVKQWEEQQGKCKACSRPLELLRSTYDHNHETGEGRGFLHYRCNMAEGLIHEMSDEEFKNFIHYIRPQWAKG